MRKKSGTGTWMHVTGDSRQICMGKLKRNQIPYMENIHCKGDEYLLYEAFSRQPKRLKYAKDLPITSNDKQSVCTMLPTYNITNSINKLSAIASKERRF